VRSTISCRNARQTAPCWIEPAIVASIKAVLDASAILAWVFQERGWEVVERIISGIGDVCGELC
jgi:hypothetical protein